ncbi:MAG: LPS-assembly protein LptD [Flavobacteriales bacterium]|nr:LPS-assembly protein LptD [Flavobacteriales bacterium]
MRSISLLSWVFILTVLITVAPISSAFAQEGEEFGKLNLNVPDSTSSSMQENDSLVLDSNISTPLTKIDTINSKDAIESRVDYEASDSMRIDMASQKIYLYGEAQVNYEDIQLNANYIEVDLKNNTVLANGIPDSAGNMTGLPVFKEGAQEYEAGKMTYNFKSKKGKIIEVKTQEGEGFIKGNEVKKAGNDIMYIRNGYYTTCNLPDPHFSLATTRLKIIPGDKIITGPTVLKIDNIPTPLGLPFGFFPNKKGRSSGIIIPTYGDSRTLGFFLRNGGFYWGINEYIDASITGDIYSLGSWGSNLNSRYRKRYKYNGNVNVSFSQRNEGIKETPSYSETNNMFVRWTHAQDSKAKPGSRFSANVNLGSSSNFRNNLNSFSNDYLTSTFQSSITYSNSFPSKPFNLTISARHNQNTRTKAFNVNLPDVSFNVSRQYPFKSFGKIGNEWWRNIYKNFGISYGSALTNQLSSYDSLIAINRFGELTQDFRNGVRHNIPLSTSFKLFKYANLSPSFNYSEVWSFETIRKTSNTTTNGAILDTIGGFERGSSYNFNTALTTKLYSLYQFRKGKLNAIRHVMTPSVSFNYQPEITTGRLNYTDTTGKVVEYSIFEQTVYGRPDRKESGRIGFGLLNNLEIKVRSDKDTTGLKKIKLIENLSINTSYDLTADTLKWNPVSINGRTRIGKFLSLQFGGVLDPYALDSAGRKINTANKKVQGDLFRLTSGSFALNFRLTGKGKDGKKQGEPKKSKYATQDDLDYINANLDRYIDFSIPWSLNVSYNLRYAKPAFTSTVTQTMNLNADLSLTENWKIGATSGWDFERNDFTYTSVNINRDLHCWQLAINWIPYGPRQSYNLTLNVKSSVLQDLKLNRRRDFYDVIR